jgi:hypothetical protein
MTKLITLQNLGTFASEIKAKYAKQSALEALQTKVNALEVVGGQANVLEGVKVNGTALAIADKMVDILVKTGTANGSISVNNANIAVAGLQALAYKAQISEADLDAALKAVLDAKATGADVTALAGRVTTAEGAISKLNGGADVSGSVANQIAAAFAALTGNDTDIKTLQALVDWVDEHAEDALELSNQVTQNKNNLDALTALVGKIPDEIGSSTIIEYISESFPKHIADNDVATLEYVAGEVEAIQTTLDNNYYPNSEIDGMLLSYVQRSEIETVTAAEITALLAD